MTEQLADDREAEQQGQRVAGKVAVGVSPTGSEGTKINAKRWQE